MFGFLTGGAAAQRQPDEVFQGELTENALAASYDFALEAGQIITLTTASSDGLDTVLTLFGPDGQILAQNDDFAGGGLLSRLTAAPLADGTYRAEVTGYNDATGHFALILSHGFDAGLSDAARILREERLTLDADRAEASYRFDLAADDILVATTFALTDEMDSTLSLRDAHGNILAENDDRGDGTFNSQIIFQTEIAGQFEVVAGAFGDSTGEMILSLAIDPEAELPFDFHAIEGEVRGWEGGMITDERDSFEFPVTMVAGETMLILGDAISGDLDMVLRLNGPDGFPVAMNDDRGDGSLNSAIVFTAPAAGTYTLVVGRYRGGVSTGEFEINLLSVDASVADTVQALMEYPIELSGPELLHVTPDFNIYYTLEGLDASSEAYVQSVGVALQDMLDAQVNQLGWAEPIRDDDGRYRAYVTDAGGSMGVTMPVEIVFDNPNTTDVRETAAARAVFLIDNDFVGMGKTAPVHSLMRATVTHEFNHVVQYAYDSEEALDWLYEATASWLETTTVGADQDATDYTETDFDTPQLCWTTTVEGHDYGQWTLLESLANSYGDDFIVRIWENSVTLDGFDTMQHALTSVGTNIPDAIQRWRAQNYAAAYELAPLFPIPVRRQHTMSRPGRWMLKSGLEQLGANYIDLELDGRFAITLTGDANLEVLALGHRNGEIEVIPLGRNGVVDTTGFETTALMVFNRAMPEAPGICSGVGYALEVSAATAAPARTTYRFSAEHFVSQAAEAELAADEASERDEADIKGH